jgi:hypothetical protein
VSYRVFSIEVTNYKAPLEGWRNAAYGVHIECGGLSFVVLDGAVLHDEHGLVAAVAAAETDGKRCRCPG